MLSLGCRCREDHSGRLQWESCFDLSLLYRRQWIWGWLIEHAPSFGFKPYNREPWHWDYKDQVKDIPAYASPPGFMEKKSFTVAGLVKPIMARFGNPHEGLFVVNALIGGERDENKLAILHFYFRHPEQQGFPIHKNERVLIKEWLVIRNTIRPYLRKLAK